MTGRSRTGLRGRPDGGWPLDRIFVSVAALRSIRELFRGNVGRVPDPVRAWDLALWTGVSPQAAANALKRMEELELVELYAAERPGHARSYRIASNHPLTPPLARLFTVERQMVPRPRPFARAHRG